MEYSKNVWMEELRHFTWSALPPIIMTLFLFTLTSCHRETRKSPETEKLFELVEAKKSGIAFQNDLTYTEDFNTYLFRSFYNGAGTGLADLNNDGYLDLFFCGNQVDNKLYLGDGEFNFEDVTEKAGVASPDAWSTGVSIVDIDQDGWLDIYVCKSGDPMDKNRRNELFINKGTNSEGIPVFQESAEEYGIDDLGFSVHAVFFDYDKDDDLDMYLSNNSINPSDLVIDVKKGIREVRDGDGGDKLYRNDGGYFTDVSDEAGIYSSVIGFGLGISVSDVNRDSWPDIYVANDFFEKDYLYMNNGDGTFTESLAKMAPEISLGAMGVDIADLNHDGYPEIFVTEMLPQTEERLKTKSVFDTWDKYQLKVNNGYHRQFPRNTLQLNNGKTGENGAIGANEISFSEVSRYAGTSATDWSWGVQMADFDLDGNNEIFVTNGIAKDLLDQDYIDFYNDPQKVGEILKREGAVIKHLIDEIPSRPIANYMYKQTELLQFEDMADTWGLGQPGFSSGSAYGDIDNDGDLDLVVNNIDAPPFLYRNNSKSPERHFITLDIQNENGSVAVGAQAIVTIKEKKHYKELYPMRGVMSVVDSRLNFGVGTAEVVDSIEIVWPSGKRMVRTDVPASQFLTYAESDAQIVGDDSETKLIASATTTISSLPAAPASRKPLLAIPENTPIPDHVSSESNYVDFNTEKLLYKMQSNEGPKMAVSDVNGDGEEDFFIAGAKGFSGTLYIQQEEGFVKEKQELFEKESPSEDSDVLFFDADGDSDMDLIVTTGGPEFSLNSFALIDRLYINDGQGNFEKSEQLLPNGRPASTSVVINADFDNDGDEDLFFGGRSVPGSYGVPASSFLLENDGKGNFRDVTKTKASGLLEIGMVTDAVWMDYDSDKDQDLIIAGEWMPIRIFENKASSFEETTENTGMSNSNGFWNTLEKYDLDGDGKEDLIAGNLGKNTFFKASPEKPVQMFVNDFDQNGDVEQIITTYNGDKPYPLAQKKELTAQLPYLLKKYLKHTDYQQQQITDIFSEEQLQNALEYKVSTTASTVFWNEGGRFQAQELPFEAQLAPVYAVYADTLENNGTTELVLGGNQYRAKPQTGIYAGSYGTVLRISKTRDIQVLDASVSGLHLEGQVRDIKKIQIGEKKYLVFARNIANPIGYEIEE